MQSAPEAAQEMLNVHAARTHAALLSYLPADDCPQKIVIDAIRHSLLAGGKRLRPALVLEWYLHFSGETDAAAALPFACAVEMIHTYSLIHDDLPCMDNADLRRGRPSCHVQFGEANALLAGDGLLSLAFETALSADAKLLRADRILRAAALLARASGIYGMVGGQVIDLESENRSIPESLLQNLHELKTGAMIRAAACIGAILGGASDAQLESVDAYAAALGLQFQIVDDILNVTATPEETGKPAGLDEAGHKTTYVTLFGVEGAREKAKALSDRARQALIPLGSPAALLGLVDVMLERIC